MPQPSGPRRHDAAGATLVRWTHGRARRRARAPGVPTEPHDRRRSQTGLRVAARDRDGRTAARDRARRRCRARRVRGRHRRDPRARAHDRGRPRVRPARRLPSGDRSGRPRAPRHVCRGSDRTGAARRRRRRSAAGPDPGQAGPRAGARRAVREPRGAPDAHPGALQARGRRRLAGRRPPPRSSVSAGAATTTGTGTSPGSGTSRRHSRATPPRWNTPRAGRVRRSSSTVRARSCGPGSPRCRGCTPTACR